jgi:hypothetical protein
MELLWVPEVLSPEELFKKVRTCWNFAVVVLVARRDEERAILAVFALPPRREQAVLFVRWRTAIELIVCRYRTRGRGGSYEIPEGNCEYIQFSVSFLFVRRRW